MKQIRSHFVSTNLFLLYSNPTSFAVLYDRAVRNLAMVILNEQWEDLGKTVSLEEAVTDILKDLRGTEVKRGKLKEFLSGLSTWEGVKEKIKLEVQKVSVRVMKAYA